MTNAERRDQPSVGAVMVLDAWPGNPYGHVAYVESVDGPDHWTVSHANLAVGDRAGGVDGVPIYRAACQAAPGGVRLGSTAAILRLRGFLYPPGAPPS